MGLPLAVVVERRRRPNPRSTPEFGRFAYLTFLVPLLYEATDLGVAQATVRSASRAFAAGSRPGPPAT